ncbi:MAG: hypothetical protein ACFB50_09965 [Rubrobacteraceae bacterium]
MGDCVYMFTGITAAVTAAVAAVSRPAPPLAADGGFVGGGR